MTEFISSLYSDRIGGRKFSQDKILYKFEKIKRLKKKVERIHPDHFLMDLGVGEPDWMADPMAVEALSNEAADWNNRGYTDNGILPFQAAAAQYMEEVFDVAGLDPETQIYHGIGSKSILALLPFAFINPGDIALVTVPGYPILGNSVKSLGGEVVTLPLLEKNRFLPDFSILTDEQKRKAKLLYLNYPNNPTGAVADKAFYQEVIEFSKQNSIIVVSDEAYASLVFKQDRLLSFLSQPGAQEVGVSIHSLSKAFNMTGWRIAFLAGNAEILRAFASVKDNFDSGQFAAIQLAAAQCLQHPEISRVTAEKYLRRHRRMAEILQNSGLKAQIPQAGFYQYIPVPSGSAEGPVFYDAESFSLWLLEKKGIVSIPWDDAGAYIRISVTFCAESRDQEEWVYKELSRRLGKEQFYYS